MPHPLISSKLPPWTSLVCSSENAASRKGQEWLLLLAIKIQVAAAIGYCSIIASGAEGSWPPVCKVFTVWELFPILSWGEALVWLRVQGLDAAQCSPAALHCTRVMIRDRSAWGKLVSLQPLPGPSVYNNWVIWNTNVLGFGFRFCFKLHCTVKNNLTNNFLGN